MRASQKLSPTMVEVDDICALDPVPETPAENVLDATVEIELTAEQMEAMLNSGSPLTRR